MVTTKQKPTAGVQKQCERNLSTQLNNKGTKKQPENN